MTHQEYLQHVGMELKVARIRKKLTIKEVAGLTGMSMHGLNMIENGKTDFKILSLKRAADALQVSLKDIL